MTRTGAAARLIVVAAVLLVAGGIVAMHQLSIGHSVVLPVAEQQLSQPATIGHQVGPMMADDHAAASEDGVPAKPGHRDHDPEAMTCLAVIGLLLLAWLLWLSPRLRCYPARRVAAVPIRVMVPLARRRRALSLLELSICRT